MLRMTIPGSTLHFPFHNCSFLQHFYCISSEFTFLSVSNMFVLLCLNSYFFLFSAFLECLNMGHYQWTFHKRRRFVSLYPAPNYTYIFNILYTVTLHFLLIIFVKSLQIILNPMVNSL